MGCNKKMKPLTDKKSDSDGPHRSFPEARSQGLSLNSGMCMWEGPKTAFSYPFISPWRSLRKCYPTVGVQRGHNVAVMPRFDKAGSHPWCYLPSPWRPLPARGFHLAHSAKRWMWKEQSVWELLILSPWWDCFLVVWFFFFNRKIRCCASSKTRQSMGEFISLWQVATLWSPAESKCYCRVITKGRGK